jgi:hypothetical protein
MAYEMELVSYDSKNFHFLAFSRPEEPPGSAIPDKPCDPWVEIVGDIKGNLKQVKLLDLDLTE